MTKSKFQDQYYEIITFCNTQVNLTRSTFQNKGLCDFIKYKIFECNEISHVKLDFSNYYQVYESKINFIKLNL